MAKKRTKPSELTMQLVGQLEKKYAHRKKENISEHIDEILYGCDAHYG